MKKRPDAHSLPAKTKPDNPTPTRAQRPLEPSLDRGIPRPEWLEHGLEWLGDPFGEGDRRPTSTTNSIAAPWVGRLEGDRLRGLVVLVPPTTNPDRPTPLDGKVAFEVDVVDDGEGGSFTASARYSGEPDILVAGEPLEGGGAGEAVIHHAYRIACDVLERHGYGQIILSPELQFRVTDSGDLAVDMPSVCVEAVAMLRLINTLAELLPAADRATPEGAAQADMTALTASYAFDAGFHFGRLLACTDAEELSRMGVKVKQGGAKGGRGRAVSYRQGAAMQRALDEEYRRDPKRFKLYNARVRVAKSFKVNERTVRRHTKDPRVRRVGGQKLP
jgi:hypothetical protein